MHNTLGSSFLINAYKLNPPILSCSLVKCILLYLRAALSSPIFSSSIFPVCKEKYFSISVGKLGIVGIVKQLSRNAKCNKISISILFSIFPFSIFTPFARLFLFLPLPLQLRPNLVAFGLKFKRNAPVKNQVNYLSGFCTC